MKLFHETNIKFYRKEELKICVFSDIHFSYQVTDERLNSLVEKMRERKPNYILIPGDIVDSNDMISDPSEEKRLLNWLKTLGEIAPVLISEGNHDIYKKATPERKKQIKSRWEIVKNTDFIAKVNALENVYYLDNEKYEDKNIYVLGVTLNAPYYRLYKNDDKYRRLISPTGEDPDEFLRILDNLDQKLITNLPKGKLKIALIHSPAHLDDYRIQAELSEFDYLVAGHMHNGLVTPLVDELWRSDRGVVSASKRIVAKNTRLSRRSLSKKMIITGAVTTWHESVGIAHNLNAFYPSYFITLEFLNDERFKKPNITKKYLNF